jgi:hypothetical protein
MDELERILTAKHEAIARGHVKSFLEGSLEGVLKSAPSPDKSAGSTGRTLASVKFSVDKPNKADPGVRNVYPEPDKLDVDTAVGEWKPFQKAVVTVGVPYYSEIQDQYPIIEESAEAARARLERDQSTTVRRANNAK